MFGKTGEKLNHVQTREGLYQYQYSLTVRKPEQT